jgi:hypothetical protein
MRRGGQLRSNQLSSAISVVPRQATDAMTARPQVSNPRPCGFIARFRQSDDVVEPRKNSQFFGVEAAWNRSSYATALAQDFG